MPASEPAIIGTRIFDTGCLKELCQECECGKFFKINSCWIFLKDCFCNKDTELYNAMRQLAIRVIVNKDFSELHAFLNEYYKSNGGVVTCYLGVEKEMIKLFTRNF